MQVVFSVSGTELRDQVQSGPQMKPLPSSDSSLSSIDFGTAPSFGNWESTPGSLNSSKPPVISLPSLFFVYLLKKRASSPRSPLSILRRRLFRMPYCSACPLPGPVHVSKSNVIWPVAMSGTMPFSVTVLRSLTWYPASSWRTIAAAWAWSSCVMIFRGGVGWGGMRACVRACVRVSCSCRHRPKVAHTVSGPSLPQTHVAPPRPHVDRDWPVRPHAKEGIL